MSTPRFYCENLATGLVTLDEAESRHARSSLRLNPGDEVLLFDGAGAWARGVIAPGDDDGKRKKQRGLCVKIAHIQREAPPARELILIVAACKGSRLTWMIEKLTELGATGIVIAEFERSVVHAGETRVEKLRRTSIEAAKQSRRFWLPSIEAGASLKEALAAVGSDNAASALLVAHPAENAATLADCLLQNADKVNRIVAVVGPEGGLSDAEIQKLSEANGTLVRLARNILRVETAAVSVAAAWAARCE